MLSKLRLTAIASVGVALVACGPDEPGNPDTTNQSQGGTSMGAGGTSAIAGNSGGAVIGAGGNTLQSGTAGIAGGSGVLPQWNDTVTEGCPVWPANKLTPAIGPFFFGPSPGPCRDGEAIGSYAVGPPYTYDAQGLVVSYYFKGYIMRVDRQNGLVMATYRDSSPTADSRFTYEVGKLIVDSPAFATIIELDARGYPRRATFDDKTSANADFAYLYEYENCRIARKVADPDFVTAVPPKTVTYTYDAKGRELSLSEDGAVFAAYDYSCWD